VVISLWPVTLCIVVYGMEPAVLRCFERVVRRANM
jgi:hypothetical protein